MNEDRSSIFKDCKSCFMFFLSSADIPLPRADLLPNYKIIQLCVYSCATVLTAKIFDITIVKTKPNSELCRNQLGLAAHISSFYHNGRKHLLCKLCCNVGTQNMFHNLTFIPIIVSMEDEPTLFGVYSSITIDQTLQLPTLPS